MLDDRVRRAAIRCGFIVGSVASLPFLIAAIGWTAHWNVYVNLTLTLGGLVIYWTGIAATLDRYQRRGQ